MAGGGGHALVGGDRGPGAGRGHLHLPRRTQSDLVAGLVPRRAAAGRRPVRRRPRPLGSRRVRALLRSPGSMSRRRRLIGMGPRLLVPSRRSTSIGSHRSTSRKRSWTGRRPAASSRWEEAAATLPSSLRTGRQTPSWFEHAILRLAVGDAAGYRSACRSSSRVPQDDDRFGRSSRHTPVPWPPEGQANKPRP